MGFLEGDHLHWTFHKPVISHNNEATLPVTVGFDQGDKTTFD